MKRLSFPKNRLYIAILLLLSVLFTTAAAVFRRKIGDFTLDQVVQVPVGGDPQSYFGFNIQFENVTAPDVQFVVHRVTEYDGDNNGIVHEFDTLRTQGLVSDLLRITLLDGDPVGFLILELTPAYTGGYDALVNWTLRVSEYRPQKPNNYLSFMFMVSNNNGSYGVTTIPKTVGVAGDKFIATSTFLGQVTDNIAVLFEDPVIAPQEISSIYHGGAVGSAAIIIGNCSIKNGSSFRNTISLRNLDPVGPPHNPGVPGSVGTLGVPQLFVMVLSCLVLGAYLL